MHRHTVAAWFLPAAVTAALAAGAVAPGAGNGRAADAPAAEPCANFGRVGPGLYRGAEPGETCLRHLADLGVRMVVNLRDEDDDSERERARVAALGMRYVNMPLSGFGRPAPEEVREVVAQIAAAGNQPVFVHCRRGRDRTGVVIAAFRMTHDGWAADRALEEAREYGIAWWQCGMKRFIVDFGAAIRTGATGSGPR